MVIDDLSGPASCLGTRWSLVTDGVMGGQSDGTLSREVVAGRPALRLRGDVRLENDGGFVQMALDLAPDGRAIDARGHAGLSLAVRGDDETYELRLRTADTDHPWQSWRRAFHAPRAWTELHLPFATFEAHRIDKPLDLARLRRIGLVAIGRAFQTDLALARIAFA